MLGFLYEKKLIKNGGLIFRFWCWMAFQRWYQLYQTPWHILKGYCYGYNSKEIYYFVKKHIKDNW